MDRDQAERYAETYLHDFHFRWILSVDNSLFTQAAVRFGSRIRLREHFRCMPEIIEFSNRIAYADAPLIPVRQYGTGRLDPLVARFVEGAETRGSSSNTVNDREAEQVVSTIERLCADPAYDGKTMGVVCLLGSAQARLINDRLVRTLSPEEFSKRKLRCGDAYAFQGDERDVMFLSMVAAPEADGVRLASASPRTFLRRYNVAASRARDQEWLFHSVSLDDLRPDDLRRKLLSHFLAPTPASVVQELADISDDEVVAPFDSIFEQRVYKAIRGRGYKVDPQVEVHGFRIDLVVSGRNRRLAVECDGDQWHGPERYESDQGRQRDLERCGWTFLRVRGSDFFRDPVAALEPLWVALELHGVEVEGLSGSLPAPAVHDVPPAEITADIDIPPYGIPSIPSMESGIPTLAESHEPELAVPPAGLVETRAFDREPAPGDEEVRTAALPRYMVWAPDGLLPAIGSAAMTTERLARLMVDIVAVEGPILGELVYRRLGKATGAKRVTNGTRRALNPALALALRKMWLDSTNPAKGSAFAERVLVVPRARYIVVRERGERDLEDIPADEIAAVARAVRERTGISATEPLKRRVLDIYGRTRLTDRASRHLDACLRLIDEPAVVEASGAIPTSALDGMAPPIATLQVVPDIDDGEAPSIVAEAVIETPADEDAGASFWDVLFGILRRGASLPQDRLDVLGGLWAQADRTDIDEMRRQSIKQGAEDDWSAVARFVAANTPGRSGETRGAYVDLAYMEFLLQSPGSTSGLDDLAPWSRRLFDMWQRPTSTVTPLSRPEQLPRCIHGSLPAECQAPTCTHHALGGIDLTKS